MLKFLALSVMVVTLSACSTLGDLFVSGTNAAYVVDINGGSVSTMILKADLTESEVDKVVSARDTIKSLRDKFSSAKPENLLLLQIDYFKAKDAYLDVYEVVVAHKNEYASDEWRAFEDAHKVALSLDESVSRYILQSDMNGSANQLMLYLTSAAKLAMIL